MHRRLTYILTYLLTLLPPHTVRQIDLCPFDMAPTTDDKLQVANFVLLLKFLKAKQRFNGSCCNTAVLHQPSEVAAAAVPREDTFLCN